MKTTDLKIFTVIGDDKNDGHQEFNYYCEKGGDYMTFYGIPYTGLVEEYDKHNGNLDYKMAVFKGHERGYEISLDPEKGRLKELHEKQGVRILWNEEGALQSVSRFWNGANVEGVVLEKGQWISGQTIMHKDEYDKAIRAFDERRQHSKDPNFQIILHRTEPLHDLYVEALQKYKEGKLFDCDWLYVASNAYDPVK